MKHFGNKSPILKLCNKKKLVDFDKRFSVLRATKKVFPFER